MADGIVARLKILLGIDSAEVATGAKKAEAEVSRMSKGMQSAAKLAKTALGAMGAALTVDALMRVTKQALAYTTEIKSQAREAGVTTKALQELRYAALQAGVADEQLTDGLKELTLKIGEAADGSKSAAAAFADAGVSIRDANDDVRDAADILPELSDAYLKIKSPAERATFAAKLFGEEAGPKMQALLEQGSAGMLSYREAAQQLGLVISDVNIAKAEDAEKKMKALTKVLSVKIAAEVSENADAISDLIDVLGDLIEFAGKAARAWSQFKGYLTADPAFVARMRAEMGSSVELVGVGASYDPVTKTSKITGGPSGKISANDGRGAMWGSALPQKAPWSLAPKVGWPGGNKAVGGLFGGTNWGQFTPGSGSSNWMTDAASDYAAMARSSAQVAADTGVFAERAAAAEKGLGAIATGSAPAMLRQFGQLKLDMEGTAAAAEAILERLFPEQADRRQFDRELEILNAEFDRQIKKGGDALAIEQQRVAAVEALRRAYLGLDRDRIAVGAGEDGPAIEAQGRSIEEINDDIVDRSEKTLGRLGKDAEDLRVRFVGSFAQMFDGALREADRFANGLKSGNILDIVGGLLNMIDQLAGLFSGGKGWNAGPFTFGGGGSGSIPGFASGGSMRIGGLAGVDRNLLSLNGRPMARVSAGETMTITPANDRGGGRMAYFDLRGAVMTEDLLRQMNGMVTSGLAQAAPAIASAGAQQALAVARRQQARSLAR